MIKMNRISWQLHLHNGNLLTCTEKIWNSAQGIQEYLQSVVSCGLLLLTQGLFCACTRPMRSDVTLLCLLPLAGRIYTKWYLFNHTRDYHKYCSLACPLWHWTLRKIIHDLCFVCSFISVMFNYLGMFLWNLVVWMKWFNSLKKKKN